MGSSPLIGVSASKGDAILSISKYKTKFKAWLEIMEQRESGFCFKNGYETPERIDPWELPLNPKHAPLRWGLAFEDAICDMVGNVTNREKVYIHPKYDWITCHVDGEKNGLHGEMSRNQENKTAFDMAFKMGWGEPESDMIPKGYMIQIQHQMLLTGQEWTDLNVLVFPKSQSEYEKLGYRVNMSGEMYLNGSYHCTLLEFAQNLRLLGYFHKYHVKADPELQQQILDEYLTFWNENVLKQIEPEINGESDIKWLIASPEGEIEATPEMANLWSEKCDTENEIRGMQDRIYEIKNNFAQLLQIEIASKNVKAGNEDHKLNVYSGSRKLASITRPKTNIKISSSMVTKVKEDNKPLYEEMKKTSFADLLKVDFTDKQKKTLDKLIKEEKVFLKTKSDKKFSKLKKLKISKFIIKENNYKFLKSLKLTKLLSKDSIIKTIQKNKPELYNFFFENGIVEESEGKSSLRMTGNKEE